MAKHGYTERSCPMCGTIYKPASSSQKVCGNCASAFKAAQSSAYHKARRAARGGFAIGAIIPCADCGTQIVHTASLKLRCTDCLKKRRRVENDRWAAANPEAVAAIRHRAKDNHYFGGNREKTLERDGYKCVECGSTNTLNVHHIDGLGTTTPKEDRNNALENLQTLCGSCHMRHHMLDKWHPGGALRQLA